MSKTLSFRFLKKRKYLEQLLEEGKTGNIRLIDQNNENSLYESYYLEEEFINRLEKFLKKHPNREIFNDKEIETLFLDYLTDYYLYLIGYISGIFLDKNAKKILLKSKNYEQAIKMLDQKFDNYLKFLSKDLFKIFKKENFRYTKTLKELIKLENERNIEKMKELIKKELIKKGKNFGFLYFPFVTKKENLFKKIVTRNSLLNPNAPFGEVDYRFLKNEIIKKMKLDRLNKIEKNIEEKLKIKTYEYIQSIFISEIINNKNNLFENKTKSEIINLLNKEKILSIIKKNKKFVHFNIDDNEIEIFINNYKHNLEWILSGIYQGKNIKKFLKFTGKENKTFKIYDEKIFQKDISGHIKNLITKEKTFFSRLDINKWNPADIYILDSNIDINEYKNKLRNINNIYKLNEFIIESVSKVELLPYSIKKILNEETFLWIRNNLTTKEKLDRYKNSKLYNIKEVNIGLDDIFKNKYVYFISEGTIKENKFETRTFHNSSAFAAELTSSNSAARHGKIGENSIIEIYKEVIEDEIRKNPELKKMKTHIENKINEIKNLNVEEMKLSDILKSYFNIYKIFLKDKENKIKLSGIEEFKELKNIKNEKEQFKIFLNLLGFNIPKNNKLSPDIILKNIDEGKIFYKNKKIIFNKEEYDKLSEEDKKNYILISNDWKYSKYKSLKFLELFLLSKDMNILNKTVSWMYLYASSQLDISSIYLKSQEISELEEEINFLLIQKNWEIPNRLKEKLKNTENEKEKSVVILEILDYLKKKYNLNIFDRFLLFEIKTFLMKKNLILKQEQEIA